MLSKLQKEKISHYFRVVLDQDKNKVLEENDFKEIGKNLCDLWGYKPYTEEYDKMIDNNIHSWEMFQLHFKKKGGIANEEYFLEFFDEMLKPKNEEIYNNWVVYMISAIFDSFDINNDGIISVDEYTDMFMCYHIPIKHSAKSFVKLDRDGDNCITRKELMDAVNDFFKSSDEKDVGNWLFGFWGNKD